MLTQSEIDTLLDNADVEEHVFFNKLLVVAYRLGNNYVVHGKGGVIDPANFDIEKGRKAARQDASNQLWVLEGYRNHRF